MAHDKFCSDPLKNVARFREQKETDSA